MTTALEHLANRVEERNALARVGQALWMRIGHPLQKGDLVWANTVLGVGGAELVWVALEEMNVLQGPGGVVDAGALAGVLQCLARSQESPQGPLLVWTLPGGTLGGSQTGHSYAQSVMDLITTACAEVVVVSPFLEGRGVGMLLDGLLSALQRGVHVVVITHKATDSSSLASGALQDLRSQASGLPGTLDVYSALEQQSVLLHSKIVVADSIRTIIGSANITGPGLGSNLEVGVVLGPREAKLVRAVVDRLLASNLVTQAFSSRNSTKALHASLR